MQNHALFLPWLETEETMSFQPKVQVTVPLLASSIEGAQYKEPWAKEGDTPLPDRSQFTNALPWEALKFTYHTAIDADDHLYLQMYLNAKWKYGSRETLMPF
jgi:hypothetical protein